MLLVQLGIWQDNSLVHFKRKGIPFSNSDYVQKLWNLVLEKTFLSLIFSTKIPNSQRISMDYIP